MLRAWLVTGQHAQARENAASAAQYLLLGGFAAVAAGISARGLTGFARTDMELSGPWPVLLFLALDGAAGVCAVLLARRAARAESGLAPRLAVRGLVAAPSSFNWTHAPRRPAAPEAFGLMPAVAALLFEFCLRELRLRTLANRTGRTRSGLGWLHPAERIRVQLYLTVGEQVPAEKAATYVRIDHAARRLYQLRTALAPCDQPSKPGTLACIASDAEEDEQSRSWRDAHRVTYVRDLSQTSGQPLPAQAAAPSPSGDVPLGLWDCLCWRARSEGFAVERQPGCPPDGTTLWTARRIRILPSLTSDQAVWALAHQRGHVLLHDTAAAPPGTSTSGCQGVRKAEADSVAFITCARHGVPIEHDFARPHESPAIFLTAF